MKKTLVMAATIAALPATAFAGTTVVEGADAAAQYEAKKGSSYTLAQKDKIFILRAPDGTETPKPKTLTVKAGEVIFLTNEEEKYVHNVYDSSDDSWVLKKQEPSGVASIAFSDPGEHKLRCAIHPKMKIKVTVE